MKKILLAAVAALAIVGCSQNEEIEKAGEKAEINFGTVVSKTTRAAVTDNTNFKAFKVNAYIVDVVDISTEGLGNAYMNGVEYKGEKGTWTGATYYWPVDEKIQFFAYPSSITDFATEGNNYPTFSFAVNDAPADQLDLVVAHHSDVTKPADNKAYTLAFKHILTRVNFSYKPENPDYTYTISDITIKGLLGGTAKYTFDEANGKWNTDAATKDKSYTYSIVSVPEKDGEYYKLDDTDGSLMLLPQAVAGKTIEITYTTKSGDHTFFNGKKTVTLPAEASAWGIGQNIRYKLTLPVGGEAVKLDTGVSNWNSETGSEVTPDATVTE